MSDIISAPFKIPTKAFLRHCCRLRAKAWRGRIPAHCAAEVRGEQGSCGQLASPLPAPLSAQLQMLCPPLSHRLGHSRCGWQAYCLAAVSLEGLRFSVLIRNPWGALFPSLCPASEFLSFLQVSQDGKALLDVLQRPLSPGNSESLTATANYSKAVHQVLDVVHEVLHHQRRLESIWQHRKVRLHQRLQLCVFQQDVQQVTGSASLCPSSVLRDRLNWTT